MSNQVPQLSGAPNGDSREPQAIRIGDLVHFSDPKVPAIKVCSGEILTLQSVTANDDATELDVGEPEMFTVRQTDEDGNAHTICLSPRMAAELSRLLDGALLIWRDQT
jgi:hypothetical protein